MRVICVKPITVMQPGCDPNKHPEVGDTDTVIDDFTYWNGIRYFSLERFGNNDGFMASHFATLPDQTDDEMQEERREAIANLETILV